MSLVFALAGNQNSGKTTLFNKLTGSNQHVGNFPGVTIEKKEGKIKKQDAFLVDLPGIYSLSPYTMEEIVTRDFLIKEKPDLILNIVDATNIERNLYLTMQLIELSIPMVIALNMMDEVRNSGNSINVEKLSHLLGIPIVPISASKSEGLTDLLDISIKTATEKLKPKKVDFCKGEIHKAINSISHLISDQAIESGYPIKFAVTKLIEGDIPTINELKLSPNQIHIVNHVVENMEKSLNTDKEAALADMRYDYIQKICEICVIKRQETKEQIRSEKIDKLLTHKYFGIPIFLGIMFLIFYLTFGLIGKPMQDFFEQIIASFIDAVSKLLISANISAWLYALIVDAILNGVGSVLSFLPLIVILFLFLSLLEDSGYMARVAFVMDKMLRKIGLSGKSFVPMIIGFGCSVPAIMATRTLSSNRDRKMTIILTPFMSCSAKLPIYGMITMAFFPNNAAIVMISLYIIGILVAIISGFILKNTVFKGSSIPFIMELPAYRIPSSKSVIIHMWGKAMDFIKKAFTVIFLGTIVIWFLQSFNWSFDMVDDSSKSILASIGALVSPIFAPIGFNDWRASTALITGFAAKEAVVSTLTILCQASSDIQLSQILSNIFTPLSSFSFLVFTLLYMPCIAAFAASKRELGSLKNAILAALYQTGTAYIVAFIIYQTGLFFS